jgi:dihydrofolate synthase/folylpolyglutamate synthase
VEVAKQQRASQESHCSLPPDLAEPDPTYRQVLDWVWSFSARPRTVEQMAAQRAVKLERMQRLLDALGHPERRFPSLLVAGTKGKGSTVAMLAACLQAAGYRTGRYTSPHLVNWRERTAIDGMPISTDAVVALAERIRPVATDPELTTFEVGTAFAFEHFARSQVDVAVVEVGTGGRFDATNLVEPLVSVITPISYDHTATLGSTLAQIAWHKAGILRSGRTGISAPQVEEARIAIEREAQTIGALLEEVEREWRWTARGDHVRITSTHRDFDALDVQVRLIGDHQRDNATTAVGALHALDPHMPVARDAIVTGLRDVIWPGRLQVLGQKPLIVLDGAHNAASAKVLMQAIEANFAFERLHLVVGLTEGKDAHGVLDALVPRADAVYLTRSAHERAAATAELAALVRTARTFDRATDALDAALASAREDDLVLITGSLFLVGEALVWWRQRSPR